MNPDQIIPTSARARAAVVEGSGPNWCQSRFLLLEAKRHRLQTYIITNCRATSANCSKETAGAETEIEHETEGNKAKTK